MTARRAAAAPVRALAILAVLGLSASGCGASLTPRPAGPQPRVPPLPYRWVRGMNLSAYDPVAFGVADGPLAQLRAAGSTDVSLVVTWYMTSATDDQVAPDPAKSPSDASVLQAAATARRLGLSVTLKPHVDVLDGTFRGQIRPADRQAWWASYDAFAVHEAALAARAGARTFVVGTELTSMASDTAQMRTLIAASRRVFHGRLTYAANWASEAARDRFWNALDVVGVDAYMPLSTASADPSTAELVGAWRPWIRALSRVHAETGKPVLFTELGYASRAGATQTPAQVPAGAEDPGLQARAYRAAFLAWRDIPWFEGISWWDWPAATTSPGSDDYTPRGKPAEQVLRTFAADGLQATAR